MSFVFTGEVRIPESDGGSLSGCVPSMKDGSCSVSYHLSVKENDEVIDMP